MPGISFHIGLKKESLSKDMDRLLLYTVWGEAYLL